MLLRRALRASGTSTCLRALGAQSRVQTQYVRGGTGHGVVNTDPQPEGIYYKYIYTFDNIPDHFGGFTDGHSNAYLDRPFFESDNWEFEYHGQWWDIGGARTLKLFYLLLPVILWLWVEQTLVVRRLTTDRQT